MQITCVIFVVFIIFCQTACQLSINSYSTSKENYSDDAFTEIRCHTKAHLHSITYIWHIDHFDFQRPERQDEVVQNWIISPTFSPATSDKVKWYLQIGPGIETFDNLTLYLTSLSCVTNGTVTRAKFKFSFLDYKRKFLKNYTSPVRTFSSGGCGWGWDNILIEEVVSPDNTLNIICEIVFCEYTNNNVDVVYCNRTDTTLNPHYNHSQHIAPSIENSELSDMVLLISKDGQEQPVKKATLAAHSPVFAAMLEDGMKKSEEIKRMNLTDLNEPVFDELIKYINTNRSENIGKMSADLLVVAERYSLNNLKTICLEELSENLTVGNAVDTFLLADKHGFGGLKSKAIRFIAANHVQVSNTTDWENVVKTNQKIVRKVFQVLSNSNLSDEEIARD